jgi:hypothetical protein
LNDGGQYYTSRTTVVKKFSRKIICLIIVFFPLFIYAQSGSTHEYRINGSVVEQKEFDTLLAALKEVPGTWFCAETKDGGTTGYNAVDSKGTVYVCRFISESNRTKASLSKKSNDAP